MHLPKLACLGILVLTIVSDDTVRTFDTASHDLGFYLYTNWWKIIAPSEPGIFGWLKFNTIEVLIVAAAALTVWRNRTERLAFVVTPELLFAAAFLGAVTMMLLYGLLTGGALEPALWQVRPFFHMGALAFLLTQALRTRDDIVMATAVLVAAITIKAAHVLFIFVVIADAQFSGWRELVGHEDSVFFVAALAFLFSLFLYDQTIRHRFLAVVTYPLILAALLLNLRRAGYAAFAASMVIMPFVLYQKRRLASGLILAAVVLAAGYLLLFWNSGGTLAIPAQKVRSFFVTEGTDFTSNIYRVGENANLWLMVKDNPLGTGFGKPFEEVVPLADISHILPNWDYHPHNMVFGLWMSLGSVNFIAFLVFVGAAMMSASFSIRKADTASFRPVPVFCLVGLASAFLATNLDQFIWSQRGALFTGGLVGVVAATAAAQGRALQVTSAALLRSPRRG